MNWIYKQKDMETISDFPDNTHGFVYRIVHKPTGKIYIGRKIVDPLFQFNYKANKSK